MSDITCHRQSLASDHTSRRSQSGIFAAIYSSIKQYLRRMGRRRHLETLNRLSDQQLSDIGITRGDIYQSASLGNDEDVTCHLARIAKQRRQLIYRSGNQGGDFL